MRFAALALALLCSCTPPEECADGGDCLVIDGGSNGACGENPPATPRNLLPNPGFECGEPPLGWFADHGQLSITREAPRSGTAAARLHTPENWPSASLWIDGDAVTSPGARTFCTRAWMRGSGVGRLSVRKMVSSSQMHEDTYSSPLDGGWAVVPPSGYGAMKVSGADAPALLLRVWMPNPSATDWLEVDDVQLWETTSGSCAQR